MSQSLVTKSGTISGTGRVQLGALRGPCTIRGRSSSFVGTYQIEASDDNGSTWDVISTDGIGTAAVYTAAMRVKIDEPEPGILYALNCTAYTSGSLLWRVGQ